MPDFGQTQDIKSSATASQRVVQVPFMGACLQCDRSLITEAESAKQLAFQDLRITRRITYYAARPYI